MDQTALATARPAATDPAFMVNPLGKAEARALWAALAARLAQWNADWTSDIGAPEHPTWIAPDCVVLTDTAVFEALATAAIAANARWDRIAAVRADLAIPFTGFDTARFAASSDSDLATGVAWFRARHAGGRGLAATLVRLRDAAARLQPESGGKGAAAYLRAARAAASDVPEDLAMLLGHDPRWKLPGIGIAVAAEALRLLGFDLCKPDRHVLRALGSWKLMRFARWDDDGGFAAPQPRPAELTTAMLTVRHLAEALGQGISFTNSAIWLAGAVSGARLTNGEFAALAPRR